MINSQRHSLWAALAHGVAILGDVIMQLITLPLDITNQFRGKAVMKRAGCLT